MKLVKYDKFLETALDLPLLRSERNGRQRGNILVDELEKENPKLKLNVGGEVKIDKENAEEISDKITTDGEYDSDKGIKIFKTGTRKFDTYKNVIEDEKGNKYKLNQFKKDEVFGSSGAGVNTRDYENLQCIYLAHKLVRPNVELNRDNILQLLSDYNEDGNVIADSLRLHINSTDKKKVDEVLVKMLSKPDWVTTLEEVTEDLYNFSSREKLLFKPFFRGRYHVYHISTFKDPTSPFNQIIKRFKKLLPSGVKIDFSKFCPADVIVMVNDVDLVNLINVDNIDKLTDVLNSLFVDRVLIPISLKKVGVTVNDFKTYSIIVNNEKDRPLPDFKIDSFVLFDDIERGIGSKIKVKSSWVDAKGQQLSGEDRFLSIDSSNTSNKINVDGEVEGKFSRHGKISYTYMKYFINLVRDDMNLRRVQIIDDYATLSEMNEEELISKINEILNNLDILKIHRNRIKITNPKNKKGISTGKPIGEYNRKNKLISKLQSLQIVNAIIEIRDKSTIKGNLVINKIMRYALSIEADGIITPRYVRVI